MDTIQHVTEDCQCKGKRCIGCKEVKCYGHFGFRSREHISLKSYCRPCDSKRGGERMRQQRIAYATQWAKEHPERFRENVRRYAQRYSHSEQYKASRAARYQKNPGKYIVKALEYQQSHPENRKAKGAKRRARKAKAIGSYTTAQWLSLKALYENTCLRCRRKEPEIKLTADHVIPLAKGGSNDISNIQPLCKPCNSRKHTKTIDYRPNREGKA